MNKIIRVILILLFDLILILFSNISAFIIRLEVLNIFQLGINKIIFIHYFFFIIFYLIIFYSFKLKNISIRFLSLNHSMQLIIPLLIFGFVCTLIPILSNIQGYPRSIGFITFLIFITLLLTSRVIISKYLLYGNTHKKEVIFIGFDTYIYDLILSYSKKNKILSIFVNKQNSHIKKIILGIKVRNFEELFIFLDNNKVDEIIIDHEYFNSPVIKKLFSQLDKYQSRILAINSKNKLNIDNIQQVEINDLLDRGISKLEFNGSFSKGDSILITGGAGSIGSSILKELVKNFNFLKIICLDFSEINIYRLQNNPLFKSVKFIIGNINDSNLVNKIIYDNKINIIFHAAAYKHVPIMENSIHQAIENNCKGTLSLAEIAIKNKVEKFIFISSDKAVRPTNIMGLSKRIAESIIDMFQQNYKANLINTKFSIVRFGNVIDSSGSLIPLLKSQILSGGPITITHKDVTRYFMTLSEAAHLVVESSFLTKGEEIFLFEMGEPVRIINLAKRMINLYGLQIKSHNNPSGIELKVIGLRPGEKLFEELLVDHTSKKTINPNIFISDELRIVPEIYQKYINFINKDLINTNHLELKTIFSDNYAKYLCK